MLQSHQMGCPCPPEGAPCEGESQHSVIRNDPMDRLDELTALVAILDSGSLAAAGRKLRRSPPAMTRLLGALEQRVGTPLPVQLAVPSAQHLAPKVRAFLDHAARALASLDVLREVP
jgi:DNA-binding transcriptional LysR family regulator